MRLNSYVYVYYPIYILLPRVLPEEALLTVGNHSSCISSSTVMTMHPSLLQGCHKFLVVGDDLIIEYLLHIFICLVLQSFRSYDVTHRGPLLLPARSSMVHLITLRYFSSSLISTCIIANGYTSRINGHLHRSIIFSEEVSTISLLNPLVTNIPKQGSEIKSSSHLLIVPHFSKSGTARTCTRRQSSTYVRQSCSHCITEPSSVSPLS